MDVLTYAGFLAAVVLPPLAALVAHRVRRGVAARRLAGVALLVVLALAYTTPWDHALVVRGVWTYGAGRVAATVWRVPVEEYAFIVLQTLLTGLWTQAVAPRPQPAFTPRARDVVLGVVAGVAVGVVGVALLRAPATRYLGAILAWGAFVLALQWGTGWRYLWRHRGRLAAAVLAPTVYLAVADRLAIAAGLWTLSPTQTTGVTLAGLPVEEAVFFLVTNLFVAQGLLLYDWVVARWG